MSTAWLTIPEQHVIGTRAAPRGFSELELQKIRIPERIVGRDTSVPAAVSRNTPRTPGSGAADTASPRIT